MAKLKPEEPKAGAPEWLATFSDMMTLLLCFFVLLFASSSPDPSKFQELANSMKISGILPGGLTIGEAVKLGNGIAQLPDVDRYINEVDKTQKEKERTKEELSKMASDFKTYFAKNNLANAVDVNVTENSVNLLFDNGVMFDSGKADLKPEALVILDLLAEELIKYPANHIKVEGHTDNVPIGTSQFPSNWELSSARAVGVARFFVDAKLFDPVRLSAEGFGEYRPRLDADNATEEGRSKNRRVEVRIMAQSAS